MKKNFFLMLGGVLLLFLGTEIASAAPVYSGQTADKYHGELVKEAKENGYLDLSQPRRYGQPVTQLKREILGAERDQDQIYLSYTDEDAIVPGSGYPNVLIPWETQSLTGKLRFVDEKILGQSQVLYPGIYMRYADDNWRTNGVRTNLAPTDKYIKDNTFRDYYHTSQGFMYAESNADGSDYKVKQFDYIKSTTWFKVMWNPNTESLMFIAKEKEDRKNNLPSDKVFVMTTKVDTKLKYILVSGELFYFGDKNKHFSVLNQMSYDISNYEDYSEGIPAIQTYGNNRGIIMNRREDNSSVAIRTDVPNGPANWMVKDYPFTTNKGTHNGKSRGTEAASLPEFMSGFTPSNNIKGAGFENTEIGNTPGYEITPYYKMASALTDITSVSSLKLKSDLKELSKGTSITLSYGFQPATYYNVPTVDKITDVTKNHKQDLKVNAKWRDQNIDSTGGKIKYYIGTSNTPVGEFVYNKAGNKEGDFEIKIDAKHFPAGKDSMVRLEIFDSLYGLDGINNEEHTSTSSFKVTNKRVVPIDYQTSSGTALDAPAGTTKSIELLDNETKTIQVPLKMGPQNSPLESVTPNDPAVSLNKSTGDLKLTGSDVLKDGVKVNYKSLNVDANVKRIEVNSKKPLLTDLVDATPVPEYQLKELEPGKPLKPYIDAAIAKETNALVLEHKYYTLITDPAYEVLVDGQSIPNIDTVPDKNFEIIYKYQGEVGITKVPVLTFGEVKIGNNAELKNLLTNDTSSSSVEIYNTVNNSDRRMTVELQGDIEKTKDKDSDPDQSYNGQLHYATSKDNDQPISNAPIEILKTQAKDNYSKVNLKGSNDNSPGMYLNQFPGNYGGSYQGTVVWKIVDDITR